MIEKEVEAYLDHTVKIIYSSISVLEVGFYGIELLQARSPLLKHLLSPGRKVRVKLVTCSYQAIPLGEIWLQHQCLNLLLLRRGEARIDLTYLDPRDAARYQRAEGLRDRLHSLSHLSPSISARTTTEREVREGGTLRVRVPSRYG